MTNNIVQLNVTQQVAPAPITLQETGAFCSIGGTITAVGTQSLLTQLSDLTPLLAQPAAISTLSWSGNVVSVVTTAPHNLVTSDTIHVTIAGAAPAGYNGNFFITVTGASSFTYPLTTNPGSATTEGTWINYNVNELTQMATTYFAQGSEIGIYVLELGARSSGPCVTALATWLTANPLTIYSFLCPRAWSSSTPGFLALIGQYEADTAMEFFFITTTLTDYVNYTNLMNSAFLLIEAPAVGAYPANALTSLSWSGGVVTAITTTNHGVLPGQWFTIAGSSPGTYDGTFIAMPGTQNQTLLWGVAANPGTETILGTLVASTYASGGIAANEFSAAAPFYVTLNYAPSSSNLVTPTAFSYLVDVTPFPTKGNSALMATLKAANVNWVGTGAEGGISNTILFWGTTADGRDFTYWYSVDWVQLNIDQSIANAIINGSNNPLAPLYYDQHGINRLVAVAQNTMNSGVAFGLVLPPVTVNAVPFATYVAENPSNYPIGVYNGMSVVYTPQRGFKSITFNVQVTDFPLA